MYSSPVQKASFHERIRQRAGLAPPALGTGISAELTQQGRFKVRHLIVRPGKIAWDLQSHFHRSEHWVAVSAARAGLSVAEARRRDLYENQSVDIPAGHVPTSWKTTARSICI